MLNIFDSLWAILYLGGLGNRGTVLLVNTTFLGPDAKNLARLVFEVLVLRSVHKRVDDAVDKGCVHREMKERAVEVPVHIQVEQQEVDLSRRERCLVDGGHFWNYYSGIIFVRNDMTAQHVAPNENVIAEILPWKTMCKIAPSGKTHLRSSSAVES